MPKSSLGGAQPRFARFAPFCALTACAWGAFACGGRSLTDGSAAAGSAGASSSASGASDSGGGRSGHSEGYIAGAPSGGLSAGGAEDGCATVYCPSVVCPVNTTPVFVAGGCCGDVKCEPMCTGTCSPCGAGSHPVPQLGGCCPSCVSDSPPTQSCESGQMAYLALRQQMLEKYSAGCRVDDDCAAVVPGDRCESGCAAVSVLASQVDNLITNLQNEAGRECLNCPALPAFPCDPPQSAVCVKNVCQIP